MENGFTALLDNLPAYSALEAHSQHGHIPPVPNGNGVTGAPKRVALEDLEKGDGKWRRTRTGCLSCRRRKVKCDEQRPICNRCARGKLDCAWPEKTGIASPASSSSVSVSSKADSLRQSHPIHAPASGSSRLRDWSGQLGQSGAHQRWSSVDVLGCRTPSGRHGPSPRSSLLSLPPISTVLSLSNPYQATPPIDDPSTRFDSLFGLPKPVAKPTLPLNYYQDQRFVGQIASTLQGEFPEPEDAYRPQFAEPLAESRAQQPMLLIQEEAQSRVRLASPPLVASNRAESAPVSSPRKVQADIMHVFSPQPAIDPILRHTSQIDTHRAAAGRASVQSSGEMLEHGPPRMLQTGSRTTSWTVPPNLQTAMEKMPSRHAELLTHYLTSIVGLFNPIDHPLNPFRALVAKHATESLALLHAILAISAVSSQPRSPEGRAEAQLYFEAAVDLFVRSLQQQDDISLFILLLLSLYSAFEGGTFQPEYYSRQAQAILNERFALFSHSLAEALPDFRFLVRLHVWYEVLANTARPAGDLRDIGAAAYGISEMLEVIKMWDEQDAHRADERGIDQDYAMSGLLGVPTFFIELLHDISLLREQFVTLRLDPEKIAAKRYLRQVQELEVRIQQARPRRLLLPPCAEREQQTHQAVSVRFFDLFRLACSIHLLVELRGMPIAQPAIQARVREMVSLLGNIEQNSNYNTSGIFAFFIGAAAATDTDNRSVLSRRLDSTWNSPPGSVTALRAVLEETWERHDQAVAAGRPSPSWRDVAKDCGWTLLCM